jgi:hypothetical protein
MPLSHSFGGRCSKKINLVLAVYSGTTESRKGLCKREREREREIERERERERRRARRQRSRIMEECSQQAGHTRASCYSLAGQDTAASPNHHHHHHHHHLPNIPHSYASDSMQPRGYGDRRNRDAKEGEGGRGGGKLALD